MPLALPEVEALLKRCTTIVPGSPESDPGEELIRIGEWCRTHGHRADRYGEGPLRFDDSVARMPARHARTLPFAAQLATIPGVRLLPTPPQVNLFHLYVNTTANAMIDAREQIAAETGVWLSPRYHPAALPGHSFTEFTVGDNMLTLQDADLMPLFTRMFAQAGAA